MHLVHQSLPESSLEQIDTRTGLGGRSLAAPVLINAMTGGAARTEIINGHLAELAGEMGLAMAVGSQTAGLREPSMAPSYRIVRQVNPHGVILANLSAGATVDQARAAVEMIEADLLQVHLNAPQELVMGEGDRDFQGHLANIARLVEVLSVPVLVKECGFGLSRETARRLYQAGVRTMDISGRGGTNFAWIEAVRSGTRIDPGLEGWGIPTAAALAEVAALRLPDLTLIASGGIEHGSQAVKALALGARLIGIAGAVLRPLQAGGQGAARAFLAALLGDIRRIMLLCGARTPLDLWRTPVVLTGEIAQWANLRGVSCKELAGRSGEVSGDGSV